MSAHSNIDRRMCHRVVPLEILCLGLSRTGTHSLRSALKDLGYNETYHFFAVAMENPRDAEMWIDAFETKFEGKDSFKPEDWDKLLGHCMAVTDAPCTTFWRELLDKYPDRKIILTERDNPEQYYRSFMSTLYPYFKRYHIPTWNPAKLLYRALCPKDAYNQLNGLNCRYAQYETFPRNGRQRYLDYNAEVKKAIPKDRLLVFNVKEGWVPLCTFLGKPIPSTKFPKGNSAEDMREIMRQGMAVTDAVVTRKVVFLIVTVIFAVGAIGYARAMTVANFL